MFNDFPEVIKFIDEQDIKLIDLKYCDLIGRWHHVTVSVEQFNIGIMTSGIGFDGSSVGFRSVKSGDMVLIPDLSTGFIEPFWENQSLSFLCDIVEADTKQPFAGDPRQLAKKAEKFLKSSGIATKSTWGPEFEFHILDHISIQNNSHQASYRFDSSEGIRDGENGYRIPKLGGYHAIQPNDKTFLLRNKICLYLERIGIPIKYHHHEVGSPGQCEIETPMMTLLASADAIMTIKYVTKMAAYQAGMFATYLPKPFWGEAGNGMHFHQQLIKDRKNLFYDHEKPYLLSDIALYYIGGLLTHAPALLAFTNPSTNSYRRLIPGFEAPVNCFYSLGNRSAAIRIPAYATQHDQVRLEFRPPDATCNPYYAISAMLLAGLDGIYRKIDPQKAGFGPINEDVFSWSPEKQSTLKSLPSSLDEALTALEKDHKFLLVGDVFNKEIISDWIKAKRNEVVELNLRPHPYEIEKYFDI